MPFKDGRHTYRVGLCDAQIGTAFNQGDVYLLAGRPSNWLKSVSTALSALVLRYQDQCLSQASESRVSHRQGDCGKRLVCL